MKSEECKDCGKRITAKVAVWVADSECVCRSCAEKRERNERERDLEHFPELLGC